MKVLHTWAAVAALAFTAGAGATTTSWGNHGPLEVGINVVPSGSFSDFYNFTTSAAASISSTTVANNLAPVLNLTGGTVSLYEGTQGVSNDTLIGTYNFDGTTGSTSHTFSLPSAGNYFYSVKGAGSGTFGGLYSLTSTTASGTTPPNVPEPHTLGLMITGVAAQLLYINRRRRG